MTPAMQTSPIIIRPALEEDAAGIARVHVLTWHSQYRGILPDSVLDAMTIESRLTGWRQRLGAQDAQNFILAAECGGEIRGFCSAGTERSGELDQGAEVYGLYVLAADQGQGIGRELLSHAAAELIHRGYTSLLIWALRANSACGFYQRMGGDPRLEKWFEIGGESFPETGFVWPDIAQLITSPAK